MSARRYAVEWSRTMTGESGYAPGPGTTRWKLTVVSTVGEVRPTNRKRAADIAEFLRGRLFTNAAVIELPSAVAAGRQDRQPK